MKDNQHEQLFTELTPEEGSVIEGGAYLNNTLDRPVHFRYSVEPPQDNVDNIQEVTWMRATLGAGELREFAPGSEYLAVTYDSKIGRGVKMVTDELKDPEGYYAFERDSRNKLMLIPTDGFATNFV